MDIAITTATATLYERLGGRPKIEAIIDDMIANHLANPVIVPRFAHFDTDYIGRLRGHAIEFFCLGCGGPNAYTGRDMRSTHAGMNISEQEFVAVLDDILAALDKNGVGQQERQEILATLYALKKDIVRL